MRGTVALAIGSLLITLLGVEVGVRIVIGRFTPAVMMLDDELGWVHRPNVRRLYDNEAGQALVETNALGLRGWLPSSPPRGPRVLVVGDSYTDGLEVDNAELFTAVWQAARPEIEVVNAGVSGYGTVQELLRARRLEALVHPVLTVVVVAAFNDLKDNTMPFDEAIGPCPYVDAEGVLHATDWELFRPLLLPIPGAIWLHRHSLAAYLVHKRLLSTTGSNAAYIEHWKQAVPDERRWTLLEALLHQLGEGRPLVVVPAPTREAVESGDRDFVERLGAIARRQGLVFVDLQPQLRAEHYFRKDIHWNRTGHRVVGTELAATIRLPAS